MPAAMYEMTKPTIHILCDSNVPQSLIEQVQYGMEEENIPYELEMRSGANALDLAWEAAQASRLSVGVGMDAKDMMLHFSKLERNQPLQQIPTRSEEFALRALGANAARLVKKMPLKPLRR